MKKINCIFSVLLVLAMIFAPTGWTGTTNFDSIAVGASGGSEQICLNGSCKTSWGSAGVSPLVDNGTTITDTSTGALIFTLATGDLSATGFTVGTGDLTFAQGGKIDGDTNGTIKLIEASDTLSFIFSGSTIQLDSSDGGFQFALSDGTEGEVDFLTNNDTDDYMIVKTASNVPTIATAGTSNLAIAPDGGTVAITGALTVSSTATAAGVSTSSTITLQNSETIVNSTNNTVEIGGGTGTVLSVLDAGTSDSDATLLLRADASADNGDDWQIVSDGATNSMLLQNDTSGSMATKFTLTTTGAITTVADITMTGTTPAITIGDAGEEDAQINFDGNAQDFHIGLDDSADDLIIGLGTALGTTPIISMTDTGVTTITGSTNGDLTIYGAGTSASDAYLRLVGDADADATDAWQFWNDSSAANLYIGNDSSVAGTYVTKLTLASSGLMTLVNGEYVNNNTTDDTVTIGSDDASLIIKLYSPNATNGTVALQLVGDAQADATDSFRIINGADGTLKFGNDSSVAGTYVDLTTMNSTGDWTFGGTTPYITIGDGGAEDTGIVFDGHSGGTDWHISLDDSADELEIGVGSAPDTTTAMTIASSTQAVTATVSLTSPLVVATQYVQAQYFNINTRPASGAPAGSIITLGNDGGNCGVAVDGTTISVCVSDGTNWKLV